MPNIKTYTAAPFNLTESDKGGQAWSQAGRRLGPLYNETAQFTREAGKLAGEENKDRLWPFDILELYQKTEAANAAKATGGRSGVRGSIDPNSTLGGLTDWNPAQANGQISTGAAALGQALSDGGQAISRKQQQQQPAAAGVAPEDMVLDQGNLVTASAARKAMQQYNQDINDQTTAYGNDIANTQQYYQRYYGGGYDPGGTGTPVSPDQVGNGFIPPPPPPDVVTGWFGGTSFAAPTAAPDTGTASPMSEK